MVLNAETYYKSITKTLLVERKNLNDLEDNKLEVHLEVLTIARSRMDADLSVSTRSQPRPPRKGDFFYRKERKKSAS